MLKPDISSSNNQKQKHTIDWKYLNLRV
jgi:hypothetical protein